MTISRTLTLPGIWAENAAELPVSGGPVVGTTYRKAALNQATVQAGWPYATVNHSHEFNEMMRTATTLLKLQEAWGILPWYGGDYLQYALVMGSNGTVYRARRNNSNKDPISNPLDWSNAFDTTPIGTISAWMPGYFTNNSNGSFARVLGADNTAAAANTYLNSSGWYVCDGSACNVTGSLVFSASGRYLPNLTDSRFLSGGTVAGGIGGSNSSSHNHTTADHTLTTAQIPAHHHPMTGGVLNFNFYLTGPGANGNPYHPDSTLDWNTLNNTGGGGAHNHGNTSDASATENRPSYLSCFYIIKVI